MRDFYKGLSKLSTAELVQILHDCEDLLGLVSAQEYADFTGKSKRYVFDLIHAKKVKSIERDGRYFVVINDHLITKST